ncbi:MAG TPA: hypothetical protein VGS58_01365 [Candidatus Sulfopaludibacter sp.]|nr:hypothetical protein [Candidatus Sulfopaludibacter sp.]
MRLARSRLFFVFPSLTLLAAALVWAQSDTPIVITDGSLTMESRGVPWSQWGTGGTRRHPNANKAVSAVDLTVNGTTQTISFNNQQCTVTVHYGGTTITVGTGSNGRNLQLSTDFNSFHQGATPNHMAHIDASRKIGAIAVKKGSATAFSGTGSGGTVITIHYR